MRIAFIQRMNILIFKKFNIFSKLFLISSRCFYGLKRTPVYILIISIVKQRRDNKRSANLIWHVLLHAKDAVFMLI